MSKPSAPSVPPLPEGLGGTDVLGVGIDLVELASFEEQLALPGSRFISVFSPREQRECHELTARSEALLSERLASRWAAKEAFIKAWSQAILSLQGPAAPLPLTVESLKWAEIEILRDRAGRPQLHLHGDVARAVNALEPGTGLRWHVSLTHESGWACAIVLACLA